MTLYKIIGLCILCIFISNVFLSSTHNTHPNLKKYIAIFLPGRITSSQFRSVSDNLLQFTKHYNVVFFVSVNKSANDDHYNKKLFDKLDVNSGNVNIEVTKEPVELRNYSKKLESSYENCYSMFYHNKRCYDLLDAYQKSSGIQFHAVVKYRGDISSPELMHIIDNPLDDTVYIPEGADWGGVNDQVAYGTPESMRKYCNCVNKILEYCANGVIFHPETLLQHHLIQSHLRVQRFSYIYKLLK